MTITTTKIRVCLFLGIGAAVFTVAGCSTAAGDLSTRPADPSTRINEPATPTNTQTPILVRGEGALIRPYSNPSLREFVADPYVIGVIEGTVIQEDAQVSEDQNTVQTIVTVTIDRGSGVGSAPIIKVVEPGGVVPLREVRSQFESKKWQKDLSAGDLDRLVDYGMEGFPHSHVGDRVVMFLADRDSKQGVYTAAATLTPSTDGSTYQWPENQPPNSSWGETFTEAQVDSFLRTK